MFCILFGPSDPVVNIPVIIFITILYHSLRRVAPLSVFREPIVLNTNNGGASEPDNADDYRPSLLYIPFQILLANEDVL